ncbi:MAG: hypothetical protein ACYC66_09865, partial [Chloroflexota bacterium]
LSSRRWVAATSLLLLGLLQGSSYLSVIGNDFTRYWAVSDAIQSLAGYPASRHQAVYIAAGMHPYSIELPFFPVLLLSSFLVFGHDTVGAHIPGLLANTLLPLLLYGFYSKAGLGRPLAYALSSLVILFPFFRLYTLNAPVPDAVFEAILVGTGYLYLHLTEHGGRQREESLGRGCGRAAWPLFGLLGSLTALTRPDGLLFVGAMFAGLLPSLRRRRFLLAVATFLATVVPFSTLMLSTFGMPWPRNMGNSSAIDNVARNLEWLERYSLRWYAEPLGLTPSVLVPLVVLLALAAATGTAWMAMKRWQTAVLPTAAALQIAFVFTVDPRASGADQWFDFFRHVSYGIPFAVLPLCFLVRGLMEAARWHLLSDRWRNNSIKPACALALLLLLLSGYQLRLLAFPSASQGPVGRQFLTSDVWVTMHDIIQNRYELPRLSFVERNGVLMIDPESRYIARHLQTVALHFDPVSTLSTGRGTGYQLSSLLVLLFGAVFVLVDGGRVRTERRL